MKSLQLLAALSVLSVTFGAPASCDIGLEIFNCMGKTNFDMEKHYSNFQETEKKLDEMCKDLIPVTKCVADAAVGCPESRSNAYLQVYPDSYKVLAKLCDKKDSLRREYLKHAKCMNEKESEYEHICFEFLSLPAELPDKDECKTYAKAIDSCEKAVQKACGDGALSMAREVYKPSRNFFVRTCDNIQ